MPQATAWERGCSICRKLCSSLVMKRRPPSSGGLFLYHSAGRASPLDGWRTISHYRTIGFAEDSKKKGSPSIRTKALFKVHESARAPKARERASAVEDQNLGALAARRSHAEKRTRARISQLPRRCFRGKLCRSPTVLRSFTLKTRNNKVGPASPPTLPA